MPQACKKCLIFDADDTLWENNIYFEAAIEEFLSLIGNIVSPANSISSNGPVGPDRQQVLNVLNEVERESIPQWGYGSRHFINSLKETFRRILGESNGVAKNGAGHLGAIEEIGERLLHHPIDVMPGVISTLETLRGRYRLMLFTKGDFQEQASKVDRSGLKNHFDRIEIVEEKNIDAYHELVLRHLLDRESTFMIGNSPRSDVLPALGAGLWAVFVPHPHTWELEHEEVEPHPRLLVAQSLRELPSLLASVSPSQNH